MNRDRAVGFACMTISALAMCALIVVLAGCKPQARGARFIVDTSKCWSDAQIVAAPDGGCAPPLEPYVLVTP